MIEKMKKVYIVSTAGRKQEMLDALMDLGAVHIAEKKSASKDVAAKFSEMSRTAIALKEYADKNTPKEHLLTDVSFAELYNKVRELLARKAELLQEKNDASAEAERIGEWGDFSPKLARQLKEQGLDFHFYRVSEKELAKLAADESVRYVKLAPAGKMAAIAALGKLPEGTEATEFTLPEKSLSKLKAQIESCDEGIEKCGEELKKVAAYLNSFEAQLVKVQDEESYSAAEQTAQVDDDLVWLSGYVPADGMEGFTSFAQKQGWAWASEDPPEDDEQVPTKVKYNKVSKIIEPLFGVLGILPGYREQDVSLWFLIFFTVFTAMIIGDAAYGFIFLIVAIVLHVKTKKLSNVVFLVYVLSIGTIVWGAITGTWFGSEAAMNIPLLRSLVIPSFANYPEYFGVTASAQQNTIIKFSFTLGVIQIALGCLLSIRKKISEKNLSFIADLGWLFAACAMYLLSLFLVLGEDINLKPVFIIIGAAFVIVVLFGGMEPGKSFGQGLKAGLGGAFTVFLDTISCFGNVMSYIRLFAVGMASLAIAQSFNGIAENFKGPWFVLAIIVLLIGHGLNLVMGLLSVVVHGVRLNVLEFSGQAGLEWTGIAYEPFKKNKKAEDEINGIK